MSWDPNSMGQGLNHTHTGGPYYLFPINGCRLYALKLAVIASYFLSKSGRFFSVIERDCLNRHSCILAWLPESRIGGTFNC